MRFSNVLFPALGNPTNTSLIGSVLPSTDPALRPQLHDLFQMLLVMLGLYTPGATEHPGQQMKQ